ncbi:MAG TPA: hypothetical protein VMT00_04970 [Thermoanaerobaculia bacterium]|nr:hypothetical protein [Thermoanaerobaculia bacterium]
MTVNTLELDASELIQRIASGDLPRDSLLLAARGLLPIEQNDLISILIRLSAENDPEVVACARESLFDLPTRAVLTYVWSERIDADELGNLAMSTEDPTILEAILRNRKVSDEIIVDLAGRVGPMLQEVIVINQERIIRSPRILEALLSNPTISNDIRRRALEIQEEFFEKRRLPPEAPPPDGELEEDRSIDLSPIADLLEKAAKEDDEQQPPEGLEDGDGADKSVFVKILFMSVSQRVQCAFRGGRAERSILVRDRNRLVCSAVVRSPRISESEIENFAAMRNVDQEVLRLIGVSREWTSKYPVMLALVRNPKAPLGVVLPLINRLTLKDLKSLSRDKNVQEGVRLLARKLFLAKSTK